MGARRWAAVAVPAALAVAGLLVGLGLLLAEPPRPDLPYPSGQALDSVRGNCASGNELLLCKTDGGPRSFLTVRAEGERRSAVESLFTALEEDGWAEDPDGRTGRDHAGGGAVEDLQPLYCKDGCVALFRFVEDGYVLAWFAP